MGKALVFILALALTGSAAAKPSFTCTVAPNPAQSAAPDYTTLHITGTVPQNSQPEVRLRTADAVSAEATSLTNDKGRVDNYFGYVFTGPGTWTAEVFDAKRSNFQTGDIAVIATCTFQVT